MPALLVEGLWEAYEVIKEALQTCLKKGRTDIKNYKKM